MRVLIVDDEELSRLSLRTELEAFEDVHILGECRNGFEAVKAIGEQQPDLVFLDIRMPKLDGFEVLELLDEQPLVVFVTAYDQYALDAFKVHAVDYLLKPVDGDRLRDALSRARSLAKGAEATFTSETLTSLSNEARGHTPQSRIAVKSGTEVVLIPVTKISFLEARDDHVRIVSDLGEHWKQQTLTSLVETLDPKSFLRIHRSFALNLNRLDRTEKRGKDRRFAILTDGQELPISRSGFARLQERR